MQLLCKMTKLHDSKLEGLDFWFIDFLKGRNKLGRLGNLDKLVFYN